MSGILDLLGLFGTSAIVLFLILVGADRKMHRDRRPDTDSP